MEALLGRGGTASVYRATDTSLGVARAIKVLAPGGHKRASLQRRLRDEARVMAALDHPNILRIFDIGSEGGEDYIVMELAEGASLQERIDAGGPLPPRAAGAVIIQVLSALTVAHAAGVIHRDIKPQNILMSRDRRALLADFGIARLRRPERDSTHRTRTGIAMGSLAFMAPEQRLDARSVGVTADLYAVGTTFYHLMTRANPFDLFAADPRSPRWEGIPPTVREVIRAATRYAPGERYPDARTMAHQLIAVIQALEPTPASPRSAAPRASAILVDTFTSTEERWWSRGISWSEATATAIHLVMEGPPPLHESWPLHPLSTDQGLDPRDPGFESQLQASTRVPPWRYPLAAITLGLLILAAVQLGQWLVTPPAESSLKETAPAVEITGTWRGVAGGFPAVLVLSGAIDELEGIVTVRVRAQAIPSPVEGDYEPETRTLTLRDREPAPDRGTYRAKLSKTGDSLRGHWTADADGRILSFDMARRR